MALYKFALYLYCISHFINFYSTVWYSSWGSYLTIHAIHAPDPHAALQVGWVEVVSRLCLCWCVCVRHVCSWCWVLMKATCQRQWVPCSLDQMPSRWRSDRPRRTSPRAHRLPTNCLQGYTQRKSTIPSLCIAQRVCCCQVCVSGVVLLLASQPKLGCIHNDSCTGICPSTGYSYEWCSYEWNIHGHSYKLTLVCNSGAIKNLVQNVVKYLEFLANIYSADAGTVVFCYVYLFIYYNMHTDVSYLYYVLYK